MSNIVSLGKYAKIKTGKLDANASSSDGNYPFFTCSRIPLRISSYSYDCECVLVAGNGDLNVKYYEGKFDAYQRTYIIESLDKQELNVRYLYYFLDKYIEKLRELSIGGVIKYIKLENLTQVQIPLPPLPVQQKIADVLDRTNALIEKRKAQIEKLDLLIKSQFIEMFGDPVTNPMGWEVKLFSDIAFVDTKMTTDFEKYEDIPHIGIDNIEKETGELINYRCVKDSGLISGKYIFDDRHIIYSKIRPNLNKVALPSFIGLCSADAYPVLPNAENCNRIFLAMIMRSDVFLQQILAQSSRTNIPKVNKQQLLSVMMPHPPIEIQTQFAAFVGRVEAQKAQLKKGLELIELEYKSLMQKCLGGDLP